MKSDFLLGGEIERAGKTNGADITARRETKKRRRGRRKEKACPGAFVFVFHAAHLLLLGSNSLSLYLHGECIASLAKANRECSYKFTREMDEERKKSARDEISQNGHRIRCDRRSSSFSIDSQVTVAIQYT